jgi:hypothetical protein
MIDNAVSLLTLAITLFIISLIFATIWLWAHPKVYNGDP